MVGAQVDGFGPGFAEKRIVLRVDEARDGDGAAVDDGGGVDGQVRGGGGEEGRGEAGLVGRGELVEVVAGGFPVLVQAEREVEGWLAAEPGDVSGDLGRAGMAVVAIEVDGLGVFAGAEREAGGVEEGNEKPGGAMVEGAGGEEIEQGEGAGGFKSRRAHHSYQPTLVVPPAPPHLGATLGVLFGSISSPGTPPVAAGLTPPRVSAEPNRPT